MAANPSMSRSTAIDGHQGWFTITAHGKRLSAGFRRPTRSRSPFPGQAAPGKGAVERPAIANRRRILFFEFARCRRRVSFVAPFGPWCRRAHLVDVLVPPLVPSPAALLRAMAPGRQDRRHGNAASGSAGSAGAATAEARRSGPYWARTSATGSTSPQRSRRLPKVGVFCVGVACPAVAEQVRGVSRHVRRGSFRQPRGSAKQRPGGRPSRLIDALEDDLCAP